MMDFALLTENLDLYCERIDARWFAEPFNLISNLSFAFVAIALFQQSRNAPKALHGRLLTLSALALAVGLGSGLFHALPNRLTQAGDVIPIAAFVGTCLLYYFRDRARMKQEFKQPLITSLSFLLLLPVLARVTGLDLFLAKGEFYLGIIPAILILARYENDRDKKRSLLTAAFFFLSAFACRTLDPYLCELWPRGTHFLWHILTAGAAYAAASLQFSKSDQTAAP